MGLIDKLAAGIEKVAEGADKAIDKGKTKVTELQIELQMDSLAKKLGYLVFDFYRGRPVDQALRQKILDDMTRLEEQLLRVRAEAQARAQAQAAQPNAGAAQPEAGAPQRNAGAPQPEAGAAQPDSQGPAQSA
ncbi:MAG: hypothetical protein N3B14_09640 [Thermoleophilia bacterium]|nr:hypothetical protein [Thermoleophilia bacterium]